MGSPTAVRVAYTPLSILPPELVIHLQGDDFVSQSREIQIDIILNGSFCISIIHVEFKPELRTLPAFT
jgi:hypothetical protein